jgi:hypothetical protein
LQCVNLQPDETVYGDEQILATNRLFAIAAAHHRLAWIHPFGDGNGRVAFPVKVLPFYFPNLFIDLPVEKET